MAVERVTVTLAELDRRRRAELRRSLRNPHPESADLAKGGFEDCARSLPPEDTDALVDPRAGKPVRWLPGKGWAESRKSPCSAALPVA